MILVKIILLLLHFTVIPVAFGNYITSYGDAEINKNPVVIYITGFFGQLGIFYLLTMAVSIVQDFARYRDPFRGSFMILCILYSLIIVAAVIWWFCEIVVEEDKKSAAGIPVLFTWEDIKNAVLSTIRKGRRKIAFRDFSIVYASIFAVMLIVQVCFAYSYQSNENSYDDFDYVAESESNIVNNVVLVTSYNGDMPSTNAKRMTASWTTFISYLSVVSFFDSATICHTYLPVFLLLIAYAIYYYMSGVLFKTTENRFIFMCLLSAFFMYGYYSHYSLTFRMLCTIWQGKAVLYTLAIPFLIVYLPKVFGTWRVEGSSLLHKRELLPLLFISLGVSSLTMMSILLIYLTIGIFWGLNLFQKKRLSAVMPLIIGIVGPTVESIFYLIFKVVEETGRIF